MKPLNVLRALRGMILTLCILSPLSSAWAEETVTPTAVFKFTAGIFSSMLVHEGAHALTAAVTDTPMTWEAGNYNQPIGFTESAKSAGRGFAVYASGMTAQVVSSEVILQVDAIDKNDAFVRGMMTWNVVNPILYTLDYWLFRISNKQSGSSYQGDLEGIEHYQNQQTANAFAIGISALAAWQGYRFIKTQDWAPEWMRHQALDGLRFGPMAGGGVYAGYHHRF